MIFFVNLSTEDLLFIRDEISKSLGTTDWIIDTRNSLAVVDDQLTLLKGYRSKAVYDFSEFE